MMKWIGIILGVAAAALLFFVAWRKYRVTPGKQSAAGVGPQTVAEQASQSKGPVGTQVELKIPRNPILDTYRPPTSFHPPVGSEPFRLPVKTALPKYNLPAPAIPKSGTGAGTSSVSDLLRKASGSGVIGTLKTSVLRPPQSLNIDHTKAVNVPAPMLKAVKF